MEQSKRVAWVDSAKGLGILAIIVSHVLTGHPISQWLFTFHVPLFFFLSGYLFREGKPFGSFLRGKIKRMLLPYFALVLPIIPAEAAMSAPRALFWSRTWFLTGQALLQRRLWPIWFLACLFLLEILGYVLIRFVRSDALLGLLAAAMGVLGVAYAQAGGPFLPWNLDACFSVMPFFIGGFLLKKHSAHAEARLSGWKGAALFALLLGLNIFLARKCIWGGKPGLNVFAGQYGDPWLTYPAAFCGIGAAILFSGWARFAPVSYLGRNSLLYFVWHQTPVITAIYYFFPLWGIPMENYPSGAAMLAEKGLELFLILASLTLCNELLLHSRLKWVLGK